MPQMRNLAEDPETCRGRPSEMGQNLKASRSHSWFVHDRYSGNNADRARRVDNSDCPICAGNDSLCCCRGHWAPLCVSRAPHDCFVRGSGSRRCAEPAKSFTGYVCQRVRWIELQRASIVRYRLVSFATVLVNVTTCIERCHMVRLDQQCGSDINHRCVDIEQLEPGPSAPIECRGPRGTNGESSGKVVDGKSIRRSTQMDLAPLIENSRVPRLMDEVCTIV